MLKNRKADNLMNENKENYFGYPSKYINIIFYVISLAVIIAVKIFYNNADNGELKFILWTVSEIVAAFYNTRFIFNESIGFFSSQLQITISKSCAGINYMIILFSMLSFSYIHKFKAFKNKAVYFSAILPISYFLTVITNSFRIIAATAISKAEIPEKLTSREVIHNLTGMLIFVSFLIIYNYIFTVIMKKGRYDDEKNT